MLDRFGDRIRVGWSAHEFLWVEAALSLPPEKQTDAWLDIAEMTGRGAVAVRAMANKILARRRLTEEFQEADRRAIRSTVVGAAARYLRRPVTLPSDLRQPTKAQLMGARA
jgi:hypothetical protein